MQRRVIGNKEDILNERQDIFDWEMCIKNISTKTQDELEDWFNSHFSGLSTDIRTGLELIVKALWAISKMMNK